MIDAKKKSGSTEKKNRAYLLWGGIADSLSDILASPSIVLPFLYLALGAPQFLAGLLLPCVKGARIVAEAMMSPYVRVGNRAKKAMILPNLVIALVLATLALSGAALSDGIVMALFVLVALIVGCCYGIWALGSNHIYGAELEEEERGQIIFTQLAISCIIAIALVWATRALKDGETPLERHRVLLWLGVLALLVSCFCMFLIVLTKSSEEVSNPEEPEERESFFNQVSHGWSLALQYAWFRRFLVARLFFLSVELATPFYTIHAATFHLTTPHILSIFVTATSAGRALGAILWRRVVRKSIRYTIAGASMIACLSALLAIGFDLFGLASNPWIYAATIFFLSFGIGGETEGRYLYLLSMSSDTNRPYMVAFSDAVAGIGGIIFAAVLGLVAQIQSVLIPLTVLAVLNAISVYLALSLNEKPKKTLSGQ